LTETVVDFRTACEALENGQKVFCVVTNELVELSGELVLLNLVPLQVREFAEQYHDAQFRVEISTGNLNG